MNCPSIISFSVNYFFQAEESARGSTIANIVQSWKVDEIDDAQSWLESFGDSEDAYQGRFALAKRMVVSDPVSAFDLIDQLQGTPSFERELEDIFEEWASEEPGPALEFLDGMGGTWPREKITRLRALSLTATRESS